ncbi:hypothetical protein BDB00DRAFT_851723 [Zychaea mexicana]|uniref:uncharacterized protein n=1 Tax=Zychaea mexicana TaxID=64656 RepID=UPI0022FE7C3B|nr:uncharacterized protein BDB00DRAFT_851723 [Zychaea mexicana]KAI9485069.1 hypothetical protein BDB00DRAFT_851723 [Zychaea mexicana]
MPLFTSKYPSIPQPQTGIIHTLFETDNQNVDRVCYVDALSGQELTFKQVKDMAYRFAAGLQDVCGFQRGDVLAMYAPNLVDYAVPVFGTLVAGGTVSPANPSYTVDELVHQLGETKAKVIVAHPSNVETALSAAKVVGIAQANVFVFGNDVVKGVQPYCKVLLGNRVAKPVEFESAEQARETLAFLCFSSGTTGKSKGVMTTHGNMVSNIFQYCALEAGLYEKESARIMAILPFFHIFGLTVVLHAPLYMHRPVYVLPRFDLDQFCGTVQKHKITFSCVVPPVLLLLAKSPAVDKYDLSSLDALLSGAAPLDASLAAEVEKRLGGCRVKQAYGLTETSPAVCIQAEDNIVPGSSGVLVPNLLAKIMGDEGKELGIGERGELWVKGPNIMKGYLNRPEETANCLDAEGYFHTGDVAIINETGHVFIVDRIKELIKYKGFQVAPAELEGILLKHPGVADCAVIGVYDREQVTEIPRAYIVLKPGVERSEKTAEELKKFVAEKVISYKKIQSLIFRDQIPKSATGKILRNVLRIEVKEEEAKKTSKL